MKIRTLTVTEVNRYLKRLLQSDPLMNHLSVVGEISNYNANSAGYAFFTLKDTESRISCVIFFNQVKRLAFSPENGMEVTVKGNISLYEKSGVYQIYVKEMEPVGIGDLHAKFENLKQKLKEKGYFENERKKPLPPFPKRIALVTSSSGAALHDILTVARRRNRNADFYIYPSLVQGIHASKDLAANIERANASDLGFDIIILARGGGSFEELWPFNEEKLADAIFLSKIPVVSAIGHETDFTLSDFTADFRAPTPSAAAELCLPDSAQLMETLEAKRLDLARRMENRLLNLHAELENGSPIRLKGRLSGFFESSKRELLYLYAALNNAWEHELSDRAKSIESFKDLLNLVHPDSILKKGYAIVYNESQGVVSNIDSVNIDEILTIVVKNGKINSRVTAVHREGN